MRTSNSVLVGIMVISMSSIQPSAAINIAASVFRVNVWRDLSVPPGQGTVWLIDNDKNGTLYFVTAAHVVLGPGATDDTTVAGALKKMEVVFGAAVGDRWDIDLASIRVPFRWDTSDKDIAVFKVLNATQAISPIPIGKGPEHPQDGQPVQFTAYGFPSGVAKPLPIGGKITAFPGEATTKGWYLTDAQVTPGMSGGPALLNDHVFAIVEGYYQDISVKYLVPLDTSIDFLAGAIPGWTDRHPGSGNTNVALGDVLLHLIMENEKRIPTDVQPATLTTGDHHCSRNCEGEPTRTHYQVVLKAPSNTVLTNPRLTCRAGACPWSQVTSVRVDASDQTAVGNFDVWGHPTTWELVADATIITKQRVETDTQYQVLTVGKDYTFSVPENYAKANLIVRHGGNTDELPIGSPSVGPLRLTERTAPADGRVFFKYRAVGKN
jgi:Trypsin-like peptidase domain